jgi:hypothetical protein
MIFKSKPNPTPDEIKSELFNSIWNIIKTWDIKVPEYDNGYMGANGSHVKLILDGITPVIRDNKIKNILDEKERN